MLRGSSASSSTNTIIVSDVLIEDADGVLSVGTIAEATYEAETCTCYNYVKQIDY